jgi:predicted ribosome-associated RNA-binding protein Tma20
MSDEQEVAANPAVLTLPPDPKENIAKPAAIYEVADVDAGAPKTLSGADLMRQGLQVEIPEKPGSAIIFYKKAQPSLCQ